MATLSIRPQPKDGRQSGFALLEVLVAVAIVAITATSLLTLRLADIRAQSRAQQLRLGLLLMQRHLDGIPLQQSYRAGETTGTFPAPYNTARWTQTIKATPFQSLWEVTVRIVWTDVPKQRPLEATTYIHVGNGST